ncbi:MAG: hypothetical protein KQ78_00834 [Candidatus Izimaplasma bacterium HR2]|nr:MAG: hypothetical protein KQ78_00834 [Candidatus Izimaplasma bacterium HR2]
MKKLLLVSLFLLAFVLLPVSSTLAYFSETDAGVYINNVDDPVTVEALQYELTVFDDIDGDLTPEIYIVLDNYTGNEGVLGDHLVVYGVTDSGDNESTYAIKIRNVDINAPEFVIQAESTLNIPQYSLLAANLPQIKAIDSFEGDITSEIIITGLELIDTEIVAAYSLLYTVSDSSGNQYSETFTVNVVDSTAPIMNGPSEIIKRSNYILDGQFYLAYFSATDDHDGIVSNRIEVISDEYVGNANNPGTYEIVISVADTQGNYVNHTLHVRVVKEMIPNLIIDNYYWEVPDNHLLTDDEFIDTLQFIGDLPNYTYVFTTTYDNYSNFYKVFNTYQKNFSLISSTGNEYTREIVLEVVESEFNIIDEEPGFLEVNSKIIVAGVSSVAILGVLIFGFIKSKGM